FKKGDKSNMTNYRPISVLSCINKIFEKLLHKRLYTYINKLNLFYEFQFGFREGYSTTMALTEITDGIKKSLDEKNYVLGIFIDLTKAFDTVDHSILLDKLNHYGIKGKANDLFRSYLTNRKQFTQINGVKSPQQSINCGVPQGSVLG
ncbi:unnamed protein product, partial [Meganyctiphanes norvegica]